MNSFHIYSFTLISGYIFYYIKHEKGSYQKYLPFIVNKAKRLLVPYVFIAAIWVVPVRIYFWGAKDIVGNYLFGKSPNQLWFLLMLFWVFAIFWLITDIANKNPLLCGIVVCILYCIGIFAPSIYCLSRGLQHILFFYIGFLIRKLDLGNKFFYKLSTLVYIILDIGLFILCKVISNIDGILFKVLSLGYTALLHTVGAISAFIILQRCVTYIKNKKFLDFFSEHNMVIYLVHQQLIYFTLVWLNGVVPPIILVLINFAVALTVSTLFSVLMHKTKVTRFLVGSRWTAKS